MYSVHVSIARRHTLVRHVSHTRLASFAWYSPLPPPLTCHLSQERHYRRRGRVERKKSADESKLLKGHLCFPIRLSGIHALFLQPEPSPIGLCAAPHDDLHCRRAFIETDQRKILIILGLRTLVFYFSVLILVDCSPPTTGTAASPPVASRTAPRRPLWRLALALKYQLPPLTPYHDPGPGRGGPLALRSLSTTEPLV